jgi:hypothetical protein
MPLAVSMRDWETASEADISVVTFPVGRYAHAQGFDTILARQPSTVMACADQKRVLRAGATFKIRQTFPSNFYRRTRRGFGFLRFDFWNGKTGAGNGPSHIAWVLGGCGELLVVSSNLYRGNVCHWRLPRGALQPASLLGRVTIAGLKSSMTKAKKMH